MAWRQSELGFADTMTESRCAKTPVPFDTLIELRKSCAGSIAGMIFGTTFTCGLLAWPLDHNAWERSILASPIVPPRPVSVPDQGIAPLEVRDALLQRFRHTDFR
jgi:hypothetical protein